MNDVERQLEEARQNLLDLTLRNRLLHYRPSTRRSLRIVDEVPSEIVQRLLLEEKAMWFKPAPDAPAANDEASATRSGETREGDAIDETDAGAPGEPDEPGGGAAASGSTEPPAGLDRAGETEAPLEPVPPPAAEVLESPAEQTGDDGAPPASVDEPREEEHSLTADESAMLWELPEPETAEVAERLQVHHPIGEAALQLRGEVGGAGDERRVAVQDDDSHGQVFSSIRTLSPNPAASLKWLARRCVVGAGALAILRSG